MKMSLSIFQFPVWYMDLCTTFLPVHNNFSMVNGDVNMLECSLESLESSKRNHTNAYCMTTIWDFPYSRSLARGHRKLCLPDVYPFLEHLPLFFAHFGPRKNPSWSLRLSKTLQYFMFVQTIFLQNSSKTHIIHGKI